MCVRERKRERERMCVAYLKSGVKEQISSAVKGEPARMFLFRLMIQGGEPRGSVWRMMRTAALPQRNLRTSILPSFVHNFII